MAVPTNTVASNGIGVIADDQANTYVQTDQTVAQLRGFVGKSGMAVMLQGVAAAGDGGAGLFYWSFGNYTDDGVNTIVPPAAAGQGGWLRSVIPTATSIDVPGVFTNTQMNNVLSVTVNGLTPYKGRQIGQAPGVFATEAIYGGVAAPVTATVPEVDAIFGGATTLSSKTYAVAGAFYSASLVAESIAFGLNVLVGDGSPAGHFPNGVVGCEWDIGGFNVESTVLGNNMIGEFPNGTPTATIAHPLAQATAFQVCVGAGSYPWSTAFKTFNGAANVGLYLGAMGTAPGSDSQPIQMAAIDGGGTLAQCGIQVFHQATGAYLAIVNSVGGISLIAQGNNSVIAANKPFALATYTIAPGASQLPTASASYIGCVAYVTDFDGSPTYRGPVGSGGGSVGVLVFCNGIGWFTS